MVQRVLEHAGVTGGEHEAVAVGPGGVGGVDAQHVLVERVGERRERHRGAGMPGVGLLHGVHREPANRVDRELAQILVVVAERGAQELGRYIASLYLTYGRLCRGGKPATE